MQELEIALTAGAALIDVREVEEFERARVPGALLIPLAEVGERRSEIPCDAHVYIICAKGGRSRTAAEFLQENGIEAVNVAGGTEAWLDAGKEFESGALI